MEVRPEPGILTGRESFTMGVQKSPTSSAAPVLHNMRMEFGGDGGPVYRPVSGAAAPASYQGGGGELAAAAQGLVVGTGEPVKRKRGRPRKYASDGSVIGPVSSSAVPAGPSTGFSLSYTSAAPLRQESSSLPVEQKKKARGRPLGSGKKHQLDALGLGGIGFTPHVIAVKAGEDVSSKIMSFSHHGPRAVCILSANGAISNVTLRQAASSGGTVTYEGRFEILSLSGSFLLSESDGQRSRTGGLSVSLAGPDGRVLGGGVAGLLTAASPVQVVVGSFIADGGKKEAHLNSPFDTGPAAVGLPGPSSPQSRGTLSESSGGGGLGSGGGPGSPLNQSTNGNNIQQGLNNLPWK